MTKDALNTNKIYSISWTSKLDNILTKLEILPSYDANVSTPTIEIVPPDAIISHVIQKRESEELLIGVNKLTLELDIDFNMISADLAAVLLDNKQNIAFIRSPGIATLSFDYEQGNIFIIYRDYGAGFKPVYYGEQQSGLGDFDGRNMKIKCSDMLQSINKNIPITNLFQVYRAFYPVQDRKYTLDFFKERGAIARANYSYLPVDDESYDYYIWRFMALDDLAAFINIELITPCIDRALRLYTIPAVPGISFLNNTDLYKQAYNNATTDNTRGSAVGGASNTYVNLCAMDTRTTSPLGAGFIYMLTNKYKNLFDFLGDATGQDLSRNLSAYYVPGTISVGGATLFSSAATDITPDLTQISAKYKFSSEILDQSEIVPAAQLKDSLNKFTASYKNRSSNTQTTPLIFNNMPIGINFEDGRTVWIDFLRHTYTIDNCLYYLDASITSGAFDFLASMDTISNIDYTIIGTFVRCHERANLDLGDSIDSDTIAPLSDIVYDRAASGEFDDNTPGQLIQIQPQTGLPVTLANSILNAFSDNYQTTAELSGSAEQFYGDSGAASLDADLIYLVNNSVILDPELSNRTTHANLLASFPTKFVVISAELNLSMGFYDSIELISKGV